MNKTTCFLILLIMGIHNCNEQHDHSMEKEERAIYSLFIDKMAKSFPPPPPPPKDGSKPKPVNWDSISNVKVEVVVDTVMFHIFDTVDLDKEYSEYQNLVDNISSLPAKPMKTEYINSEEGHTLIFGDSLEDSNTEYSQIVGFSRIAFNEEKNMAALYAGYSTHPLASYMKLYLLKKINGRWQIVFEKTIAVS